MEPPCSDSADEWLQELLCPVPAPTDSDDEWLQELIRPGRESGAIAVDNGNRSSELSGCRPSIAIATGNQQCKSQSLGKASPSPSASASATRGVLPLPVVGGGRPSYAVDIGTRQRKSRSPRKSTLPKQIVCNGDEAVMLQDFRDHARELRESGKGVIHDGDVTPYLSQIEFSFTSTWLDIVAIELQSKVQGILDARGLVVFKIGITSNAVWRMLNPTYGYAVRGERYDRMDLLVASFPNVCAYLERALIALFRCVQGCRNDAPGGESAPKEGLCFLYLVSLPEREIARRYRSRGGR